MDRSEKIKVLFLCTGNSCRSQMAEALTRRLAADRFEAYSAGIEPQDLDPRAMHVLSEAGIDAANLRSKPIGDLMQIDFDYVVTVCRHAAQNCPSFPGKTKTIHAGFDDPPKLAESAKSEEEALFHYRRVRDEIKAFVCRLYEELMKSPGGIRG